MSILMLKYILQDTMFYRNMSDAESTVLLLPSIKVAVGSMALAIILS